MTLSPTWRVRVFGFAAALVALWIGNAVAQQDLVLPTLLVAAIAGITLIYVQPYSLTTLLLAVALCCYIIGNRGFAQISASDRLPLLPAELILAVCGGVLAVQSALRRELPFRRDLLSSAIFLWVLVGVARLPIDLRAYGFNALRDFALIYYAAFFIIAQREAATPESARLLHLCLAVSCAITLFAQYSFDRFPSFFLSALTFRGVPLIFYKGDLAGLSMAVGSVVLFIAFERQRRWWQLVLCLALAGGTLASNSRASMVSLFAAAALLAIAGRLRFLATLAGAGAVAGVATLFVAYVSDKPWHETAVYDAYERAVSVVDPFGAMTYSGEGTFNKGDNNRFRTVWWRLVYDETMETNPWFGVGFGHDIAARFIREYYADSDEFSARSPHNVLVTTFARTGFVGLFFFLALTALIVVRTIESARAGPSEETALWCASCVMLTGACFGVVLEGPMGAVVFWTVLGAANAQRLAAAAEAARVATLEPAGVTEAT